MSDQTASDPHLLLREKLRRLARQVQNALQMLEHWRLEPMAFGQGDMRCGADFIIGDFGVFEWRARENSPLNPIPGTPMPLVDPPPCNPNSYPPAPEREPCDLHPATRCCQYRAPKNLPYPVLWNEFNGVVQCHHCGAIYHPMPSFVREWDKFTRKRESGPEYIEGAKVTHNPNP